MLSHSVSDSLPPHGSFCPWKTPGKNTGGGSHSVLQGIFLTQGSNPDLLYCSRFFTICATREAPILPYDPAIPQLGTYFEKTVIQEETRSPVFLTTALLTVARRWHQAKCPPTDEQMEMWYICVVEYHSATKRNKTIPLAETWLDLTE